MQFISLEQAVQELKNLDVKYNYSFLTTLIESEGIKLYQYFKSGLYCEVEDYGLEIHEILCISACTQDTYVILEMDESDLSQLLNDEINLIYTDRFSGIHGIVSKSGNWYELIKENHLYKNTVDDISLPTIKENFYSFYGISPHKLKITKSTIRLNNEHWKIIFQKLQRYHDGISAKKKLSGFNSKKQAQLELREIVYKLAKTEWEKDIVNSTKTTNGIMANRIIDNYLKNDIYRNLLAQAHMRPSFTTLVDWFKEHKAELKEDSFVPDYASDRGQ